MNRPRESILSLFDPLNQPSSPPRPGRSSAKENVTPIRCHSLGSKNDEMTMTTFFNRMHKPVLENQPTYRQRLVDIGDATLDDIPIATFSLDSVMEEEEETQNTSILIYDGDRATACSTELFGCSAIHADITDHSPTGPRTPLADLAFDQDATPVPRSKMYKRLALDNSPNSVSDSMNQILAIPSLKVPDCETSDSRNPLSPSGLTPTINSVPPLAGHSTPADDTLGHGAVVPDTKPIIITVSPPEPEPHNLSPSCSLENSTPRCETTATPLSDARSGYPGDFHHLTPRYRSAEHSPTSGVDDPRRVSVDLQQSFFLQMQCPETSFDLLNDNISFFSSKAAADSFFNDDEESFAFTVESRQATPKEMSMNAPSREESVVQSPAINSSKWTSPRRNENTPTLPVPKLSPPASLSVFSRNTSDEQLTNSIRTVPIIKSSRTTNSEQNDDAFHLPTVSKVSVSDSRPKASLDPADLLPDCDSVFKSLKTEQFEDVDVQKQFVFEPLETPKPLPNALVPPPCPVPALRIVKRSQVREQLRGKGTAPGAKQDAPTSIPSRSPKGAMLLTQQRPELSARGGVPQSVETERGNVGPKRPSPPVPKLTRPAVSTSNTVSSLHSMAGAARRVPITEAGHGLGTGVVSQTTCDRTYRSVNAPPTQSAVTASRRAPANLITSDSITRGKTNTGGRTGSRLGSNTMISGLKQPNASRFGYSDASSALPRLAAAPSRLPGPTAASSKGVRGIGGPSVRAASVRRPV